MSENKNILIHKEKERLLNEAGDILKVVSQRWSKYTTGEKAALWLKRLDKIKYLESGLDNNLNT